MAYLKLVLFLQYAFYGILFSEQLFYGDLEPLYRVILQENSIEFFL